MRVRTNYKWKLSPKAGAFKSYEKDLIGISNMDKYGNNYFKNPL